MSEIEFSILRPLVSTFTPQPSNFLNCLAYTTNGSSQGFVLIKLQKSFSGTHDGTAATDSYAFTNYVA